MAMVGDLAHYAVDHELIITELRAGHRGERVDHQGAFGLGRRGAMLSEYRHRRVARIAIENGECDGMDESSILLRVLTQFAEFALGHESKFSGQRFAQQVPCKPGHAVSR